MQLVIDPHSVRQFSANCAQVSRGVRLKHTRIALNAWGGVVRDEAKSKVKRRTGFLSRSLLVKVTIPDASRDERHHGRPARVMVGPDRRAVRPRLYQPGGPVKLVSVRKATRLVLAGGKIVPYKPSRYAHFVEHGIAGRRRIKPDPFMAAGQAAGATRGMAKLAEKLTSGIAQELARLNTR